MAATYFIELPFRPGQETQIAVRRGNQFEIIGRDGFRPDPSAQAVAFGSCLSVTLLRAVLPTRNDADALKAALFAVEDDIAQPIETVHVILGPKAAPGEMRDIYVIDQALLADWIAALALVGLPHASIVPELSLLPAEPMLIDLGDRILASSGARRYGVDRALPAEAIDALIRPDGEVLPVAGRYLAEDMGLNCLRDVRNPPLLELIQLFEKAKPIDLRTGAFSSKSGTTRQGQWSLRTAAILAVAAFALWFTSIVIELNTLTREADRLTANARERYAVMFPGEPLPVDLAAAARSRLVAGERAPTPSFLTVIAHVYDALGAVNGARIRAIDYDQAAGTLSVSLGYAAFGDDVTLRRILEEKGLPAQVGDSRQDGAEILSVMIIEVQT